MKKSRVLWTIMLILVLVTTNSCSLFRKKTTIVDVFWDTSFLQNVTRLTEDRLVKRMPKISPDGEKLLYGENDRRGWNIVFFRDVRVPAKTMLISGNSFNSAWYPNSSNFVYVSIEAGSSRIIRSAITGGGRTYVTRNPVGRNDDLPSVKDDLILFQTEITADNWQIVSMKDNGTEITFLGEGQHPSWHPTEPKFVFTRNGDVFEMDLESLQATELYSDPNFRSTLPSYSADGEFIVFQKGAERRVGTTKVSRVGRLFRSSSRGESTVNKWQIFIMRANGTNLTTITFSTVNSFHPSMDINGFVYFVSDASGYNEIYRARVSLN
ncbi:MAG: hypothetical protein FWG98_12335 [Candidatus Cloacimonetes bacterium]|nr:hypothetical protein [Candidatus Cloacimonadota bacterium]